MNIRAGDAIDHWLHAKALIRRMFPAPLGLHTRHMLAGYARDTIFVLSGVLVVALSIDLTHFLSQVLATDAGDTVFGQALHLGWYILLRCADQMTELLPLAAFLGVFWGEIVHTRSKERLIVLITGRSPLQCLAPIILFAVLVGSVEWVMIVYVRPVAVMTQSAAHLGLYGLLFDRLPSADKKWIATGDSLVHARIDYGSPPVLRDLRLYRMDRDRRLQEVIDAKSAKPIDGEKKWLFRDGHHWTLKPGPELGTDQLSQRPPPAAVREQAGFTGEEIALDIDPLWLRNFGISAKYLPDGTFRAIAGADIQPNGEYRTWAQARYAIPIATGGMAILAGSLSLLLLVNRIRPQALFVILAAGFAAHLLTKLLLLLGFHDWIHPAVAAWLTPILILACPFGVQQILKMRKPSSQPASFAPRPHFHQSEKPAPR